MKRLQTYLIFFLCVNGVFAQRDIKEQVYLHTNYSDLIAGETLRYTAYCTSQVTGELSTLSKVLYVELTGENGLVFRQKVLLENGVGHGEFFINSLIPTGTYQLEAHTLWMKNFNDFFHKPLTIINPFEKLAETIEVEPSLIYNLPTGGLVGKIPNYIQYRFSSPEPNQRVKLLGEDGTVLFEDTSLSGQVGQIEFVPAHDMSYQLLLEPSEGEVSFYKLPAVASEGISVTFEETRESYYIEVHGTEGLSSMVLLALVNSGKQLLTRSLSLNTKISITKKDVPYGLNTINVYNGVQEAGQYSFWKGVENEVIANEFGCRETVAIDLPLPAGKYSVSVRKKTGFIDSVYDMKYAHSLGHLQNQSGDSLAIQRLLKEPTWYSWTYTENNFPTHEIPDKVVFLPEVRDELIFGNIRSESGHPLRGEEILFAQAGKPGQIRSALTDSLGNFVIQYSANPIQTSSFLRLKHRNANVEVYSKFYEKPAPFQYVIPQLDSQKVKAVVARSIRNQLFHAYKNDNSNEEELVSTLLPQFGDYDFSYNLDDYTRFESLKEHVIEYMLGVNIRGKRINVNTNYYRPDFSRPQLVLLDGIPVDDSLVMHYDPALIQSLSVLNNRFYLGTTAFDGVIIIETFNGIFEGYEDPLLYPVETLPVSIVKSKIDPTIEDTAPDMRDELYWNPEVSHSGGDWHLSFRTSDVVGEFVVEIQGVTNEGNPNTVRKEFVVR